MKKLLVSVMVVFCFSLGYAQNIYNVGSVSVGEWNKYTKIWKWGSWKESSLTITIKNRVIMIDDDANSVYVTSNQISDKTDYAGKRQIMWNAKDEKYRNCIIKMISSEGEFSIYVMYNDIAFAYSIIQ